MKMLKLYVLLIRASIRARMQYKFNFLFSSAMAAFISVTDFLLLAVLLFKFGTIKSWGIYEVGYLYSVLTLSRTIYRMLASDVHHLENYLVTGELDQLLTRPVPVLLALMSSRFTIMFGELCQSILILAVSLGGLLRSGQIGWTAIPYTLLIISAGAVILFSIGLCTATAGFWITRTSDLQNITEDAARSAGQYPLSIYPKWLQTVLLTVIPVGVAAYVPARFVLRHELGPWVLAAVPLFAAAFLALSLRFWRFGISRYQSTGS